MASGLRLIEKKDYSVVRFQGTKIGTLTPTGTEFFKKLFQGFFEDLYGVSVSGPVVKKKKIRKKKTEKRDTEENIVTYATQLLNAYNEARAKFYKHRNMALLTENGPEFKHFKSAALLVQRHDVSNKKFLAAQVAGLKFANNGKGSFPKPNQLATSGAEQRLLDFIQKDFGEDGDEIEVLLDYKDKTTPLSENVKYQTARTKMMMEQASMWDAIYVKKCQLARRGKADPFIDKYIAKLKEEKKVDGEV